MSETEKGFSCWQYQDCRNHIEVGPVSFNDAEVLAGRAGWTIGHFDGQGHIACPDCAGSLWDALPLGIGLTLSSEAKP